MGVLWSYGESIYRTNERGSAINADRYSGRLSVMDRARRTASPRASEPPKSPACLLSSGVLRTASRKDMIEHNK